MASEDDSPKYRFTFSGICTENADTAMVKAKLAKVLKADLQKIDRLFSGKRVTIKSNLSYESAKRYDAAFDKCGAIGEIVSASASESSPRAQPKPSASPSVTPSPSQEAESHDVQKAIEPQRTGKEPPHKDSPAKKIKLSKKYKSVSFIALPIVSITVIAVAVGWITSLQGLSVKNEQANQLVLYQVQSSIENYVNQYHEYPSQLALVNQDIDPKSEVVTAIDEKGELEVKGAAPNITLHYRPRYEAAKLIWTCDVVESAVAQVPIECQSLDSWKNNGVKIITSDSLASIHLPEHWLKGKNEKQMNLNYYDDKDEILLVSVSEDKSEFEGFNYGNYGLASLNMVLGTLDGKNTMATPQVRLINQRPSIEYTFEHQSDGEALTYMLIAIDGKEYYHRLFFRVPSAKAPYLLPKLRVIANSHTEQYAPSRSPYQARIIYSHGVYLGRMIAGIPAGQGEFQWDDGDNVTGRFNQMGPVGDIAYTWNINDSDKPAWFSGTVESGTYSGNGEYRWPGGYFKGQIKNQLAEGDGEIRWNDGTHYEGEFKAGLMHGSGKYTWPDEDSYNGGFLQGLLHGEGLCDYQQQRFTCYYLNGDQVDEEALRDAR